MSYFTWDVASSPRRVAEKVSKDGYRALGMLLRVIGAQ